jgi:hypothetical protein
MQAYVSKGGKQYGPYAIDQLRQLVEAGNFALREIGAKDSSLASSPACSSCGLVLKFPTKTTLNHENLVLQSGLAQIS